MFSLGSAEEASSGTDTLQVEPTQGLLLPSPGARRKLFDRRAVDKLQAISSELLSQVGDMPG